MLITLMVAPAALRKLSGVTGGHGVIAEGEATLPVPTQFTDTRQLARPGPDSMVSVQSLITMPMSARSITLSGGVRICSAYVNGGRLMQFTAGSEGTAA